jgi:gliding motility-associated-like protein
MKLFKHLDLPFLVLMYSLARTQSFNMRINLSKNTLGLNFRAYFKNVQWARPVLLALLLISTAFESYAQLNLISSNPATNANNIAANSNIILAFDLNVNGATANAANIVISGNQTGLIAGDFTGGGTSTITFDPTNNFKPGELITITVTDGLLGTGAEIAVPKTFQFTAASQPGSGFFVESTITSTANGASSVHAADVDGDGDIDLLSASLSDNKIAWYENDGSQNFTERLISSNAIGASEVLTADLDLDGDLDILSASTNDSKIAWYENNGSEVFTERVITTTVINPFSLAVIDLDSDGDLDIISQSGSIDDEVLWYENDGAQSFAENVISLAADSPLSVYAADVDGDGDIDILSASQNDDEIAWYENDGSQNFTQQIISNAADQAKSVFAADIDGDGDLDVLSSSNSDGKVAWYDNDGSQNFTERVISIVAFSSPDPVYAADVDGDGDTDVLATLGNQAKVVWYINDGSENFSTQDVGTGLILPNDVFAADVDSDGDLDILTSSRLDNKITLFDQAPPPPRPTISSFSPTSGTIGTSVTITGTNFNTTPANNTVYFGAVKVTPSAGTATSLTVTVPTGATSITPIMVQDEVTGLLASSLETITGSTTRQFTLTNTQPLELNHTKTDFTVGTTPEVVVTSDFNGDGNVDFGAVNLNSNNISIRLGNGSGGFSSPAVAEVSVGNEPQSLAIGDLNGDGNPDFVTCNKNDNSVSIRLGDGLGGFTSPTVAEISVGNGPEGLVLGDFNGDGNIDLAAANNFGNDISIRLGNGLGGFTSPTVAEISVGSGPEGLVLADFNGDGNVDLAAANRLGNDVSIRLGDGLGGFSSPSTPEIAVGVQPTRLAIGDFNLDGNLDFAASNSVDNNVSIRLGDGAGGFTSPAIPEIVLGTAPEGLIIADFDGDGNPDLAGANFSDDNVSIRLGDGSASFTSPPTSELVVGRFPRSVAAGDFNGDGKADLVVANAGDNNVSLLLWEAFPIFTASTTAANFTENGLGIIFDYDANDGAGGATDTGITFSVVGTDAAAFNISAAGELSFASPPDFENPTDNGLDNVYDVTVRANNGTNDTDIVVAISVLDGGDPFITTWVATGGSITIPTTGTGYNYAITWTNLTNTGVGDGFDTGVGDAPYLISSLNPGDIYQIEISGTFPQIYFFGAPAEAGKILTVEQWGDIAWGASQFYSFYNCTALTIPAVDAPNLSNVTNMTGFFSGASAFNNDISHWDVSNVENMIGMFSSATAFNNGGAPLTWSTNTGTGMVTDMRSMFSGASSFNQDISAWDVSSVTDMSNMFFRATSFNQDIGTWDVSSVTNMYQMFREAGFSNGGAPLTWSTNTGTGNVTDMGRMFYENSSFNADISTWDVSSVLDMSWMFYDATGFNQDISTWDVSSVTDMSWMFRSASAFNNGGTALTWTTNGGTGNVTDMSNMFSYAQGFNQDVSTWDVSSVTTMYQMFRNTNAFNNGGVPLTWTTNGGTVNVTDMSLMFFTAPLFNQDISTWDVSSVTNMYRMFSNAAAFDQDLGAWDVSSVVSLTATDGMTEMFNSSGLSTASYDATLEGWSSLPLQSGVTLDAPGIIYCSPSAVAARADIISNFSWTINDGGVCEPTLQASNISFSGITTTQMDVSWVVGNGSGRVVLAKEGSAVDANPSDLTTYTANAAFASGTQIGTGNYVVYDGNGNTTTITGLTVGANYHFRVYEYNGTPGTENYFLSTFTGNPSSSATLAPEINLFEGVDNSGTVITDAQVTAVDFGTALIGSPITRTFAIENTGTSPLTISSITASGIDYSVSSAIASIPAAATQTFTITLSGLVAGTFNATINIINDDPDENPFTFDITGTITSLPPFITTWTTTDGQITIPTIGLPYDYDITWTNLTNTGVGDGSDIEQGGSYTISGLENGSIYQIEISGTFPRIYFNSGPEANKILTVEQWGGIQWGSMANAFLDCTNLTIPAIDAPDLSNVADMTSMLQGATSFNDPINHWVVDNVQIMQNLFFGCDIFNQDLNLWNVGNVTDMSGTFSGADAFNGNISNWDVSNVTNFFNMFNAASSFDQPLNWTINPTPGAAINMRAMFQSTPFNQDLNLWDMSEVVNTRSMFRLNSAFNGNIDNWNVSKVTDMGAMFLGAANFNRDLSTWDVSSVQSMNSLFQDAVLFNQDLSAWNNRLGSVTDMDYIFSGASSFNGNISGWIVTSVQSLQGAFANTANFNRSLASWDVSNVADMRSTFNSASGFDQSLGSWDISSVTAMDFMLNGSGMSTASYDATLIGWEALTTTPTGINLDAVGVKYCDAASARAALIAANSWTINDAGQGCAFITTWTTTDNFITIPTFGGDSYMYDVYWEEIGDPTHFGTVTGQISDAILDVDYGGNYRVEISGFFPRIYFNNAGDKDDILTVEQWGSGIWTSMGNAFSGCTNLTVPAIDIPNLIAVTDMTSMFDGAASFNSDIGTWDVSTVVDFTNMFQNASSFDQSLGSWDISNATALNGMLSNTSLSLGNYDATLIGWESLSVVPSTINLGADGLVYCAAETAHNSLTGTYGWTITDAGLGCSAVAFITTWQTDNPGDSGPNQISIPTNSGETYNYDIYWEEVGNPTNNGTEPAGQTGDYTITFPSAGQYRVEISGDFPRIYFNAASFNPNKDSEKLLTVEQWGDVTWTSMEAAFSGCINLQITASDAPNLFGVTSLRRMFYEAISLNADINHWDVSSITDMSELFRDAEVFNQPLGNWDVSNVTNMFRMFFFAQNFNQDISTWNVANVQNMGSMFGVATNFNQPIGGWDVSNVTDLSQMFSVATSFNQDISTWDVSSATNIISLFSGATVFNQDISGWTINATNFTNLFRNAEAFNQDISSWDVSAVTDMEAMFFGATAFNQDLTAWNNQVANVVSMNAMFASTSYNQDLTGWNVSSVQDFNGMFSGNTVFNQDISFWDVTNATDMRNMFSGASSFNQNLGSWNVINLRFAVNMLNGSGLSIANYDNLLGDWAGKSLQNNVSFGAQDLFYCASATARAELIGSFNWFINDAGPGCISVFEGPDLSGQEITSAQPTPIDFGSQVVSVDKILDFTIRNNLAVDIVDLVVDAPSSEFTVSIPSTTITTGSTMTIQITFNSTGTGNFSETVSITSTNFTDPFLFDITAEATASPEPEIAVFEGPDITGTPIADGDAFGIYVGDGDRGMDQTGDITIANIGSADLVITALTIGGTAYSLNPATPPDITIVPGATETITITLDGSVSGYFLEDLIITNDDSSEPAYTFPVGGDIYGPIITAFDGLNIYSSDEITNGQTTAINIGATANGTNRTKQITIANFGPVDLDISSISVSGSAFTITPNTPAVIAGEFDGIISELVLDITLDGTNSGVFTELVTIQSDDDNNPIFTFDITGSVINPPHIYWTENIGEITGDDEIHRTDLEGNDFTQYYSGFSDEISGLVIDTTANRLYWTDAAKARIVYGEIGASGLSTGPTIIYDASPSSTNALVDLVLDTSNGHIYFTHGDAENGFSNKIARVDLDGSNLVELIDLGFEKPFGIDLDLTNNKIYFTTNILGSGHDARLYRSDLNGTNLEEIEYLPSATLNPVFYRDVKIDRVNEIVYWGAGEADLPGTIYSNSINEAAPFSAPTSFTTTGEVRGLDIDPVNNKLYWMCRGANAGTIPAAVMRSDFDGTNKEGVFEVTIYPPSYPAVPAGSAFIALDLRGVVACGFPPTVTAGADQTVCEASLVTLAGSIGGGASTLTWTTSGDGSFNDITSATAEYTPGANDISTGSVTLTITTDDPDGTGPCVAVSDDVLITIDAQPTVTAGADIAICSANPVVLAGIIGGVATGGSWTTDGDGFFDSPIALATNYNPGANDVTNGIITLTLTTTGNGSCLAASDNLVLTITPPTADAGLDQTICSGGLATLNGSIGGAASTLTWSTAGDGSFDDNTVGTAIYTPGANDITNGSVTLTITSDDPDGPGPCLLATDDIVITIGPQPTVNVDPDFTICEGDAPTINAVIGGSASTVTWSTSGDGAFDNSNSLTAIYTPGATDLGNSLVTLTATTDDPDGAGSCVAASSSLVLTIDAAPTVSAGIDQDVCANDMVVLSGTLGGSAIAATWSSSGDGSFDDINSLTANYTLGTSDIAAGTVTLTLTSVATAGCTPVSDPLIIMISQPITAIDQSATQNVGETSIIDPTVGGSFNTGDVLTTALITLPTKGTATINGDGTISYTSTEGNGGTDSFEFQICNQCGLCSTALATISLTNEPPVVDIPPASGQPGGVVSVDVLSGITDKNGNIDLSSLKVIVQPISGANASFDNDGNLYVDYNGIDFVGIDLLTIEVCDFDGLCTSYEIMIEITVPAVVVYNAVSPNGDGKHDFLELENVELFPANTVVILNRWGDIVFEIDGYDNSSNVFEGRSNRGGNGELPSGTYFYEIDLKNGDKLINGFFTLRK